MRPKLSKDVGRKRNADDDQRSRRHHVRCDLTFQNIIEQAHAAPFFGDGKSGLAGHDTAIGSNQDVLRFSPRDIGLGDLQPVDRLIDFVGEINAVFGNK